MVIQSVHHSQPVRGGKEGGREREGGGGGRGERGDEVVEVLLRATAFFGCVFISCIGVQLCVFRRSPLSFVVDIVSH